MRLSLHRQPWMAPYGVLTLVLATVFWQAWINGDRLISGGDVLLHFYPVQFFFRQAIAAGEFPFWNPYTLAVCQPSQTCSKAIRTRSTGRFSGCRQSAESIG